MKRKHAAMRRLEDARRLATENGGACLTTEPIGERKRFEFTCPKGHRNFFKRHDAVRQGKHCPACSMEKKGTDQIKYSKTALDDFASSKGGLCLSETYFGYNTAHLWQCDKGHQWEAIPRMVLGMGSWCPECAGNKKYTLEDLNALAAERGGSCLDVVYDPESERSTATWKCHFGHPWTARVDMIVRRGDWCPHCSGSYGERLCRHIVEMLFDARFLKVRPVWLKGENGYPLEIDIYNEELMLGIEYQGPHHYKPVGYTHDSYDKITARDGIKVACCNMKEGFTLITIPEFRNVLDAEACIAEVKARFVTYGITVPDREISIDYRKVYINTEGNEFIKELRSYVSERGGSLLSDQFAGVSRSYQVDCWHGHTFTLNKYDMARGKWCRECADHKRHLK